MITKNHQVGRALGVSILDLTSSNPCSRIPNSEHRSVNGIRDWLRINCLSDSQLWTRMLHRPTRPQVLKKPPPNDVTNPNPLINPESLPSYIPDFPAFPTETLDSNLKGKYAPDNSTIDFAEYVLETVEKIVSSTSARSQDTLSADDEDRWYDRKKALQYEKELEMERIKVFERYKFILSSDKEKAYWSIFENNGMDRTEMKNCDGQKYADFKAALEEELAAKREKVKKIREQDRLIHEKFGKTYETKQLLRTRNCGLGEIKETRENKIEKTLTEISADGNELKLEMKDSLEDELSSKSRTPNHLPKNDLDLCFFTASTSAGPVTQNCQINPIPCLSEVEDFSPTPTSDKACDWTTQELSELSVSNAEPDAAKKVTETPKSNAQMVKSKSPSSEWKRKAERFRLKNFTKPKFALAVNDTGMKRRDTGKKEPISTGLRRKSLYGKKDTKVKEDKQKDSCMSETSSSSSKSQAPLGKANNVGKKTLVKENVVLISLDPLHSTPEEASAQPSEKQILKYADQTDSDISEVMLREIRRTSCMGAISMICKDELFPVLQSAAALQNPESVNIYVPFTSNFSKLHH